MPTTFTVFQTFMITGRGLIVSATHDGVITTGDYYREGRTNEVVRVRGIESFGNPHERTGKPLGLLLGGGRGVDFFQEGDVFTKVQVTDDDA